MVCDAALVVCDTGPERAAALSPLFHFLDARRIPHLLFLNALDESGASVRALLDSLQVVSARPLVLREIPLREGERMVGVVDLVSERAWGMTGEREAALIPLPDSHRPLEEAARRQLLERLADQDDASARAAPRGSGATAPDALRAAGAGAAGRSAGARLHRLGRAGAGAAAAPQGPAPRGARCGGDPRAPGARRLAGARWPRSSRRTTRCTRASTRWYACGEARCLDGSPLGGRTRERSVPGPRRTAVPGGLRGRGRGGDPRPARSGAHGRSAWRPTAPAAPRTGRWRRRRCTRWRSPRRSARMT